VTAASESHGIEDADVVDLYWTGGLRYGMTADVTDDEVTLSGGAGDVLPAAETAVVCASRCRSHGDRRGRGRLLVIRWSTRTANPRAWHVNMTDDGDATIAEKDLVANEPIFVTWAPTWQTRSPATRSRPRRPATTTR